MCSKKILVVDDDMVHSFLVDRILKRNNQKASFAKNGREGLAMADQENPQIIFLDINMPVMGGIEFAQKFKEKNNTNVILVGFSSVRPREEKHLELFDHFIEKPLTIEKMESILC